MDKRFTNISEEDSKLVMELYQKRFKTQEETLSTLAYTLVNLSDKAPIEIKMFYNVAAFVNIISYDIKVICRDMIFANSKWQKKHYARQASLVLYETMDDLFELLGKEFHKALRKFQFSEVEESIKVFRKDLNHFKKQYQTKLRDIRNTTTAHREKHALKQLNAISLIDEENVLFMTFEFEGILQSLETAIMMFLQTLMKSIK